MAMARLRQTWAKLGKSGQPFRVVDAMANLAAGEYVDMRASVGTGIVLPDQG